MDEKIQTEPPIYTTTPNQVATIPSPQEGDKLPAGRPSKYKPEYCQLIIEHMEKGYSLESFGAIAEVCKDTLFEWQKVHPEFKEAVDIGYAKSLLWWEKAGMQGMLGLPVPYKDADGKVKMSDKGINASVYALQMANKHKWRTGREDITSDDKKIEPVVIYRPEPVPEGSED